MNFLNAENAKTEMETEQDRAISTKFLNRRVSAESTGIILQKKKKHFPATFGDHLEFLC